VLELKGVRKTYGEKIVFRNLTLHVERGDRIALIGPNGAGKSTLMRLLSGVEPPDAGTRTPGHQVVMQYFAQDEATRLDPQRTVYETLADGSPVNMVPMIRTILGGFLFEGDDVHKKAAVLSGGERTRLAVARMLLRPSNTLLLDEPTNHLDLDSKDVLLDALEDFGGTLILVSHDRYFIDKLATKIVEVGQGEGIVYPGGYEEFLWSKTRQASSGGGTATSAPSAPGRGAVEPVAVPTDAAGIKHATRDRDATTGALTPPRAGPRFPRGDNGRPQPAAATSREEKKRLEAEQRRQRRVLDGLQARIATLEASIADRERQMRELEAAMAAPGFYGDHETSKPVLDRHQALMCLTRLRAHGSLNLRRRVTRPRVAPA
jgi:ATP-binding cassette subfamily F protein 3